MSGGSRPDRTVWSDRTVKYRFLAASYSKKSKLVNPSFCEIIAWSRHVAYVWLSMEGGKRKPSEKILLAWGS